MHPLDNPIWLALNTRHAHFAESSEGARRFVPEVSLLGGFEFDEDAAYEAMAQIVRKGGTVGLFLEKQYTPRPGWNVIIDMPLPQMVCDNRGVDQAGQSAKGAAPVEFLELDDADSPEMIELTALTQPGPFSSRTHELGTYLGIRENGKLVAMSGERLKVPGFTEVSAVCTHPDHLGKGYARMLMREVMRRIQQRGETACLHVRPDNARAIELYQRLGFRERRRLHLAVLRKN
jgi:predicted GNAT family acetyltransferase